MLIASIDSPTLLGVAAVVTAVGGCASTIMALRKSRNEEITDMENKLKEARAENERLAEENHRLKLEKIERGESIEGDTTEEGDE